MLCEKCGFELADDATFCIGCGNVITSNADNGKKDIKNIEVNKEPVEEKVVHNIDDQERQDDEHRLSYEKKEKLFSAGLLSMLFLYAKDNDLNKDLNSLREAWKKGELKKEILNRVKIHPEFTDVLDKSKIFHSCFDIFSDCYVEEENIASDAEKSKKTASEESKFTLSEAQFILKIKNLMKGSIKAEHKFVIDMILIMAFADKVITDKEKEGMGQLIRNLGISETLFSDMFLSKEAEISAELKGHKKGRFWRFCIFALVLILVIIIGTLFLNDSKNDFSGKHDDKQSSGIPAPNKESVAESKDDQHEFKLISFSVSRENGKNYFPLRRLFPFYADLVLETPDLNEGQRKKICNLLNSPSQGFIIQDSTVTKYADGKLSIELQIICENLGNQTFLLEMKENPYFIFSGNAEADLIFQDRITGCSEYFESRYDSAKEYENGIGFAECVNNWMITPSVENDPKLSKNEREIPQRDFDTFIRDFLKASDKPKNPFNWFYGALSVKPKDGYLPYLSIFQEASLNYLSHITNNTNPFIDYFIGINETTLAQYKKLCDRQSTMVTCRGVNEISQTDYLTLKQMFKPVTISDEYIEYSGDNEKGYSVIETNNMEQSHWILQDHLLMYNSKILQDNLQNSIGYSLSILNKNLIIFDKVFCVSVGQHFPGHSIAYLLALSKAETCDDMIEGYNFQDLFMHRSEDNQLEPWVTMANFIYNKLMQEYQQKDKTYCDLTGDMFLFGVAEYKDSQQAFFKYLSRSAMENGIVNILIEESELDWIFKGGYLIYGYDVTNAKFGAIINLSQPIFEGGYIESHGYFLPLD